MMDKIEYKLLASRGVQGSRPFYQVLIPLRQLSSLLKLDDHWDITKRSQRLVNVPRAKKFAKYLIENHKNDTMFVVPPLVGSLEGDFDFVEVQMDQYRNIGHLRVDLDAQMLLFDGQHRAKGVQLALQEYPMLQNSQVSIMLFPMLDLSERQQAFHDINSMQKVPVDSIRIAYNNADPIASTLMDTVQASDIRAVVEYEKNSCTGDSDKFWALKQLNEFAKLFCGKDNSPERMAEYLKVFLDKMFISQKLRQLYTSHPHVCKEYIHPSAQFTRQFYILPFTVTLKALAMLFRKAEELEIGPEVLSNFLEESSPSNEKNWHYFDKDNGKWEHRCVSHDYKMKSNAVAVRMTYYQMAKDAGIELSEEELAEEEKVLAEAKAIAAAV